MKRQTSYEKDKAYFHIITLIICLAIVLVTSVIILISYINKSNSQTGLSDEYFAQKAYNDKYFSEKILEGVTISGIDVGGMTVEEAKNAISGTVNYNIKTKNLIVKSGDKSWTFDNDTLKLTVDVEKAALMAYRVGRYGTDGDRRAKIQTLDAGGKIDISSTIISDPQPLYDALCLIKKEVDVETKDATVSFNYSGKPVYTYTDEVVGYELDVVKAYYAIEALLATEKETIEYTLELNEVQPEIKRADIEKEYSLVGKHTTTLATNSSKGRIQNITRALEALDNRVWLPGETFSFNQWVGARTIENGFGIGVFINEDQQYDETVGGGICQVSTTIYYAALLSGANSVGRNAPMEIIERRPHSWPSVYIDKGLDATVSWPHTDLKIYNNTSSPYFINTSITQKGSLLYVTVEFYGTPLPNNAKVRIETEVVSEVAPPAPEFIADKSNKYNLKPGESKVVTEARTGYTVNVYQIWSEPGKEDVKSLITVSKYEPVQAKIYTSTQTATPSPSQTPTLAPATPTDENPQATPTPEATP